MGAMALYRFITEHPLSRGRKLRNLARVAAWQVRSRLRSEPYIFDYANGSRMFARRGMTGATGNLYVGLHEFEDMAFVLHYLRGGDQFVDIGANVGSYVILAASAIGSDVIAFEPSNEACAWIHRNIELNGVTARVEVHQKAVSSRSGSAQFTIGLDTVNHLVHDANPEESSEVVAVTTLDDVIGGRAVSMIKMDVEGFESEVLRGGAVSLSCPALRCVLMELNGSGAEYGYDEYKIVAEMMKLGFSPYRYDPFSRLLTARGASCENDNTLFVRDFPYVSQRVTQARAFLIHGWSI